MHAAVRRLLRVSVSALALLAAPRAAEAFCGFYVAQADSKLFNQASQVVLVRDGHRTVVTMSSDFKGELTDFALVVPVPTVLERDQIHVGDRKHLERVDAFSSPRLVEYFDEDPCQEQAEVVLRQVDKAPRAAPTAAGAARDRALGVTVEAQYTVGEYDIVILSAKQSDGLETWLRESGYKVPARSAAALQPYIKQDMKFFVAKVNLKNQRESGFQYLRPLQMAYESKKFMLPIRLGMANSEGPQDLVIFTLTRQGRVESTNYRTVKVPSDVEVPTFVKNDFGNFYKDLFARAHDKAGRRALHTEYFWDMGWCDPCSADPLSPEELKGLGVFWRDGQSYEPVFLTRLHVRYDAEHFPEDLVFQETGDRENFQGRYILRHAFKGEASCSAADKYWEGVNARRQKEAETLASLTGWSKASIHERMGKDAPKRKEPRWYQKLWK